MPFTDVSPRPASSTVSESCEPFDDPLIGSLVQGRYRVRRMIGKGGMGVVYEAQHQLIGRTVALKTMAAHTAVSPSSIERFRREAQAAAAVGNSHVVDVLDMGQLDGGSLFIVLEHLDGSDLGFSVAASGPFTLARAVHVLAQLCDALSAVHAAGIVHRDLKPDNVFLIRRDGQPDFVKVLDFGVCKFVETPAAGLTSSKDLVGTPQFMAPEQVEGRASDHRSDIHALGAILFYVLTGRPPYVAMTLPKLFSSISSEAAPSVREPRPELPEALDAAIRRALEKNPEHRFQSCAALKAALLEALEAPDTLGITLVDPPRSAGSRVLDDSTAAVGESLKTQRTRNLRALGLGAAAVSLAALALAVTARSRLVGEESEAPPRVAKLVPDVKSLIDTPLAVAVPALPAGPLPSQSVAHQSAPAPRPTAVKKSRAAPPTGSSLALSVVTAPSTTVLRNETPPFESGSVATTPRVKASPSPANALNPDLKHGGI